MTLGYGIPPSEGGMFRTHLSDTNGGFATIQRVCRRSHRRPFPASRKKTLANPHNRPIVRFVNSCYVRQSSSLRSFMRTAYFRLNHATFFQETFRRLQTVECVWVGWCAHTLKKLRVQSTMLAKSRDQPLCLFSFVNI